MQTGEHKAVNDTKICPYCREVIKIDAVKCKHCQTVLSGPAETLAFDPASAVRVALAGKYELLNEIGRGGMAIVYKAEHKGLGRAVALKVLPQQFAQERELLDRFHREARALAKLKHPGIVPVYDEGFEGGIHYFAMEYLEGETLAHMIAKKGRLASHEIVPLVEQVAGALDHIHANGLVHRDVKSSNIIINRQGVPVLMDFGVAHQASNEALTAKGMILGTPEFMSPEQAAGKEVDGRTDFYSLGVVVYQALTGQFPHKGETPLMTLHKVITEPFPPLRTLAPAPEWVEIAVHRCLEKLPASRVQNGKELIQLLRHTNGGTRPANPRPRNAAPKPAPGRGTPAAPRSRRRGWVAALIVVVLLALGSLGWYASKIFMKPATIPVPALTGLSQPDADGRLRQQKLAVATVERRWGLPREHDLVVEQRPPAGTPVPPGTRVVLVVGIGKTAIPDLIGLPLQEAIVSLRTSALAVGETTRVAAAPDQKDRIVLMYPQPGTEVGKDAKVNLSIGE